MNKTMRICLYFGSFNPFHIGHLALARYMMETYRFDKFFFVLSPLNPQKKSKNMLPFAFRYKFLETCIAEDEGAEICSLEQILPEPHYSVHSLQASKLLMPEAKFSMLIGADNLLKLSSWYQYERLADFTELYVYPREGYPLTDLSAEVFKGELHICENVPMIDVSSTEIRKAAKAGDDLSQLIPKPELWDGLLKALQALD